MSEANKIVGRLESLIPELNDLYSDGTIKFKTWYHKISELLIMAFGEESWQVKSFKEIDFSKQNSIGSYIYSKDPKDSSKTIVTTMEFTKCKSDAFELLTSYTDMLHLTDVESEALHYSKGENKVKKVFITHGRSSEWYKVAVYLEKEVKVLTLELSQEASKGSTVIEKLERYTPECDFAVIVMTGDDSDSAGSPRVRENVMHEIGWFQAKYGRSNVCLIHEEGVSIPTNISGIVYISYPKGYINASFAELRREIEAS